jgi:hypothetical protein
MADHPHAQPARSLAAQTLAGTTPFSQRNVHHHCCGTSEVNRPRIYRPCCCCRVAAPCCCRCCWLLRSPAWRLARQNGREFRLGKAVAAQSPALMLSRCEYARRCSPGVGRWMQIRPDACCLRDRGRSARVAPSRTTRTSAESRCTARHPCMRPRC